MKGNLLLEKEKFFWPVISIIPDGFARSENPAVAVEIFPTCSKTFSLESAVQIWKQHEAAAVPWGIGSHTGLPLLHKTPGNVSEGTQKFSHLLQPHSHSVKREQQGYFWKYFIVIFDIFSAFPLKSLLFHTGSKADQYWGQVFLCRFFCTDTARLSRTVVCKLVIDCSTPKASTSFPLWSVKHHSFKPQNSKLNSLPTPLTTIFLRFFFFFPTEWP